MTSFSELCYKAEVILSIFQRRTLHLREGESLAFCPTEQGVAPRTEDETKTSAPGLYGTLVLWWGPSGGEWL